MKFGIVGPISKDHVVWPDGEEVSGFGAVAYSATALAKLLEGTDDSVVCLSHISPADAAEVKQLLDHPNISLPHQHGHCTGTEIELRYVDRHERVSRQVRSMTPVSLDEIALVADCDYILLMPLNETDIPLEWVRALRRSSRAVIFLDAHGLITGLGADGERFRKNWSDKTEWINYIDILKMNDKEISWAAGRFLGAYGDYVNYALEVVQQGLKACWVTFGNRSSLVACRRDNRIFWANVPVMEIGQVVDTTGCGDSASAGFLYSYAKLFNPVFAVVMGNTLGSVKASFHKTEEFPTQPEVQGMIYQHYRDYLHRLLDEFLSQQHLIIHEVKEEKADESALHIPDGNRYGYGTNDARGRHSQGPSAPWT